MLKARPSVKVNIDRVSSEEGLELITTGRDDGKKSRDGPSWVHFVNPVMACLLMV